MGVPGKLDKWSQPHRQVVTRAPEGLELIGMRGSRLGGVIDAPVQGVVFPWERGADLACAIADGDHVVKSLVQHLVDRLRARRAPIDADLGQDLDRQWVNPARVGPCAVSSKFGTAQLAEECLGHLAPRRVSGADEDDATGTQRTVPRTGGRLPDRHAGGQLEIHELGLELIEFRALPGDGVTLGADAFHQVAGHRIGDARDTQRRQAAGRACIEAQPTQGDHEAQPRQVVCSVGAVAVWSTCRAGQDARALVEADGARRDPGSGGKLGHVHELRVHRASGHTFLLVHGSPRKMNEYLFEDKPDATFARIAARAGADVIVCGHTHQPYTKLIGETRFVNVGSAGKPKDGDQRACWTLIETSPGRVEVEFRRVAYDVERAAQSVRDSDLPDEFAGQLIAARGYDPVPA